MKFSRLKTLFGVFFYISAVTVGGGLTMLPMMTREFVEKRDWITADDMVDTIALVQSMPGIIAINMAIVVGFKCAGFAGAFLSAFAVMLPPFVTISIIAMSIRHLEGSPVADRIFAGVRAAVCALILVSAVRLSKQSLKNKFAWIIMLISFASLIFFNLNAIYLIVGAAAAGLVYSGVLIIKGKNRIKESV